MKVAINTEDAETYILKALKEDDVEDLQTLVEVTNASYLGFALKVGAVNCMKYFLQDANTARALSRIYTSKNLHSAVEAGFVKDITYLLAIGKEINEYDENIRTPLHCAALLGKTQIVQVLLKNGADCNAKGEGEMTPLHSAVIRGRTEIVKLLLEKGADCNAKSEGDITPLHCAFLMLCPIEIAELLLSKVSDINAVNDCGYNALYFAAEQTRVFAPSGLINDPLKAIKLLLEKGADPSKIDLSLNYPESVKKLIEIGRYLTKLCSINKPLTTHDLVKDWGTEDCMDFAKNIVTNYLATNFVKNAPLDDYVISFLGRFVDLPSELQEGISEAVAQFCYPLASENIGQVEMVGGADSPN